MKKISSKLNTCAVIIRRYNLGDKIYFFECFKNSENSELEIAWNYGLKKIQNNEIVKDASNLDLEQDKIAEENFKNFDKKSISEVLTYLQSDFNPKDLKLKDENVERRFRHLLAKKYLKFELSNISESSKEKSSYKEKVGNFVAKHFFKIIIITVISYFAIPPLTVRLTPVNVLAEKIHEKSKYEFNGAICNDGWTSHSQGRGTCSWHGGVDHYFYQGEYSKSIEQCREEARKISWLDE